MSRIRQSRALFLKPTVSKICDSRSIFPYCATVGFCLATPSFDHVARIWWDAGSNNGRLDLSERRRRHQMWRDFHISSFNTSTDGGRELTSRVRRTKGLRTKQRVKILFTCCHIVSELDSFIELPGWRGLNKKKKRSNCTREEFIKIYCGTDSFVVLRFMCEGGCCCLSSAGKHTETVSFCKLCAPLNFAVYDTSTSSTRRIKSQFRLFEQRAWKGVRNGWQFEGDILVWSAFWVLIWCQFKVEAIALMLFMKNL